MSGSRVASAIGALVCVPLGAYVCFVAVVILIGVEDRETVLWLVSLVVFALGTALVLLGIRFGARALSGDVPEHFIKSPINRSIWGKRMNRVGYTFLAFPVWYPLLEESRLRWPRAADAPTYVFAMGMGLLMRWIGRRALKSARDEAS